MNKWYDEDDNNGDILTGQGSDIPFNERGTSQAAVERSVDACQGSKYSKAVDGRVTCIWTGGSAVNAYSLPDWEQIGHWNIEFEENLSYKEKLKIVKENINRHIEEENYPC